MASSDAQHHYWLVKECKGLANGDQLDNMLKQCYSMPSTIKVSAEQRRGQLRSNKRSQRQTMRRAKSGTDDHDEG